MFSKSKIFTSGVLGVCCVLFFCDVVFAANGPASKIQIAYQQCLNGRSTSVAKETCAEKLLAPKGVAMKESKDAQWNWEMCHEYKRGDETATDQDCVDGGLGGTEAELLAELKAVNNVIKQLRSDLASAEKVYLGGDATRSNEGFLIVEKQIFFADLPSLIGAVIDFLVKLVGTIALVLIVVAGFRLVVSAGNNNAITKSRDMLKLAVIGLVVSLLAYIIVATVRELVYR